MQNNQEQYDFYLLGQRYAKSDIHEARRLASIYEQQFGTQAREDFEAVIASAVFEWEFLSPIVSEDLENLKFQGGSLHYSRGSIDKNNRYQMRRKRYNYSYSEQATDSPKTR